MNRDMQNDDYERRSQEELGLNADPFAVAEDMDDPPAPEELWRYEPSDTPEPTPTPADEPPVFVTNSAAPEMEPPVIQQPIAPPPPPPPPQQNFIMRDGVNNQVPRCPRCGHDMPKRFCGQCGLDSATLQRPQPQPQAQAPVPPQYQNNPYQGNPYQHNPYQNNPYQRNPYQSNPYQAYQNPQNAQTFSNTVAGQTWYPPHPTAKKKHTGIIVLVICLAVFFSLLFVAAFAFSAFSDDNSFTSSDRIGIEQPYTSPNFGGNKPSSDEILPNGINLDEYKKLTKGMSYGQVSAIIGGDGQMTDSGETVKGDKYYTYSWICEDTSNEAVVHITFVDGAVTDILLAGELY